MMAPLARLFRLRLVLMNGVAALAGYLLFPARPAALPVCALFAGVSLLAASGSALNQVLERDLDALMLRTCNRPLPKGELSVPTVTMIGVCCLLAGTALLYGFGGPAPALLGVVALLCYLAVYTPLKRITPLALALGALCGALPPVIGWCLAGGTPTDFPVVLLAGIFYLWQVPHFWLLQRRHAEDYRRAGFPLFSPYRTGGGSAPLFLLWIVAMLAGAAMLPAFGLVGRGTAAGCLFVCAPLLFLVCKRREPALFASLNLFPVLVTLALCAGR
jgi:protoheme IX farnesyltransferase